MKEAVAGGDCANMKFDTLSEIVSSLESFLPPNDSDKEIFLPSQKD